jgi:hypothetical protein
VIAKVLQVSPSFLSAHISLCKSFQLLKGEDSETFSSQTFTSWTAPWEISLRELMKQENATTRTKQQKKQQKA